MTLEKAAISKYISDARFDMYVHACNGDRIKALKLYYTNLRLSQAFYPLLSVLEVILRNALNSELTRHFNDIDWLRNQQTGFMNDSSLTYYDSRKRRNVQNDFLKRSVKNAVADCGLIVTQGKIISNLSFGFWTALFDTTHYRILAGQPIQIFSNLPVSSNRSIIHQKLKKLNEFRNRVYHNESIIFSKDATGNPIFSLINALEIYNEIQEFFSFLNLDFKKWTKHINNVVFEIERAECVMKMFPQKVYYYNRIIIGIKHYRRKYILN